MRRGTQWAWSVSLALGVMSPVAVRAQSWDVHYMLGIQQLRSGDTRGAIESLRKALDLNPSPGPRQPAPNGKYINFFPYLYLTRAYLALGDCEQARQMMERSLEKDGISADHLDFALQQDTRQEVQQRCGSPAPPRPEPPLPPAVESPPPPAPPALVPPRPAVPVEVVRQAVRLYRRGRYRQVAWLLAESQKEYELDDAAYFLWGCSLTARYFWEGQQDGRLLREARAYFQRVRRLPPAFEQVLPDLVSPKVLVVYKEARRLP